VRLVPPATALILELGIDIPNYWARSGKVYLILAILGFPF